VVPGRSTSTNGSVSGPITCGAEPIRQTSSMLDLADADAARGALLDAGFASVTLADIAFDVAFTSGNDAVAAQLPAGPVAAAVLHSGRATVEAALRSFFAPRSRIDGTVRMGLVFRCYVAQRAQWPAKFRSGQSGYRMTTAMKDDQTNEKGTTTMKLTTTTQVSVDGVMQANGGRHPILDPEMERGG
jgi:hypothetical protein